MPELPEVEVVCSQLNQSLSNKKTIQEISAFRNDIRSEIPMSELKKLNGAKVQNVARRAKYILIYTDHGILLSHLGMTGSWRIEPSTSYVQQKHDHLRVTFKDGTCLIYQDPRRFGYIGFQKLNTTHSKLLKLGVEPLSDEFNEAYLKEKLMTKHSPIKIAIMDQELVVGVGNIYASEALFQAQINPKKLANKIPKPALRKLVQSIKTVLTQAIISGGSSIKNYKSLELKEGAYQNSHLVYNKSGKTCVKCKSKIKLIRQAGRSTFYCPKCQK